MSTRRRDLPAEIRAALTDGSIQGAVPKATRLASMMRRQAVQAFPGYEAARDRARAIKEDAIERLPELLDVLRRAVERSGGVVHDAADAAAACDVICGIAREEGLRSAVKSKSMTSEEVRLNAALEAAGVKVRETDLGEYIVQLDHDRPSHIIAPIIHKGLEDVRRTFRSALGIDPVPETAEELTQLARRQLRSDFLQADLGITGANFLIAESGTLIVVENEGNARLCTQVPRVHVALAGVEKVLPDMASLEPFLQLLPRSATGQLLTSYLTVLSGPGWGGSPIAGGPRRFHLVLLDNGRMAMRDDPVLREALYCVRCGACLNVCPPYQAVGGHVYGGPTYQSGIGNAWEAGVRGLETAAEFNELCMTCARCRDVCPVRIDIPWLNATVRHRVEEARGEPPGLVSGMLREPSKLYETVRRAGVLGQLAAIPPARWALERWGGIDRRRPLPQLPSRTLTDSYARRGGRVVSLQEMPSDVEGKVVFWADCHTENVEVKAGLAALEVLEALGYDVLLAATPCCGRAALSAGDIPEARRQAAALTGLLEPWVERGAEVVGLEPSCVGCLSEESTRLLGDDADTVWVGLATKEVMRFLADDIERLRSRLIVAPDMPARRVIVHGHCQQKSAGWFDRTLAVLNCLPGVTVVPTQAECCGMAGSYGYKTTTYEISRELGIRLIAEIDELQRMAGAADEVLASGTSCRAQMADLGGRRPRHPVEVVAEWLRSPAVRSD